MRRFSEVFPWLADRRNLWGAWRDFRRNKGGRASVRAFEPDAAAEVVALADELAAGSYRPLPYRLLFLHEPKRRLIAAAHVRDRVVHHATVRVLAPIFDPTLITSTFACLEGRGTHCALLAMVAAMRRTRYLMLLDIRRYFLSIDRDILIDEVMARRLKDRRALTLLRTIADSGAGLYARPEVVAFLELEHGFPPPSCGLPIGNLTSQWWGNHYLSGLDHFAKRTLKVRHYLRYMDDVALLADDARQLEDWRAAIAGWLREHRRLQLKRPDAPAVPTREVITYLGHRVSQAGVAPTQATLRRMQRRIAGLVLRGTNLAVERTIAAYSGVLRLRGRG